MFPTANRPSIALAFAALLGSTSARADVIQLRGGGLLQGVVEPDPAREGHVRIWTATASIPLSMKKERVESVVPAESPLTEYLTRRAAAPATADGQVDLAHWCEQTGLTGPAQGHYEEALKLDPQHPTANEKLGRVFWDGQYRTYDEIREAQGLVKAHGRWMNPEEKARADQRSQETTSQRAWTRRVAQLVEQFNHNDPAKRAEAERLLRAIREPAAIVPLVNTLGHEQPALRTLLADVLGAIDDPKAALGLAHRAVAEEDGPIRAYTIGVLAPRKSPEVVAALMKGLDAKEPPVVGRAAAALAALDAGQAVPKLVPKLVSTQKRMQMVMMPAQNGTAAGGGMGMNVGFSQQQGNLGFGPGGLVNSSVRNSSSGTISGPANGSAFLGTNYSFPVITGVATAPGAIAFGVSAAPLGNGIGFSTGGGGIGPAGGAGENLVPTPVAVPYRHQNGEVLAALQQLTGQDFGFNVDAWMRWLRTDFQPTPAAQPGRRVPQP